MALGSLLGSVWSPEAQVWGTGCLEIFPSRGARVNHWLSECPLENIQGHTRLLRSTIIDSTICFSLAAFTDPSGPPSNAGSDTAQHDMKVREGALESDNGPELKYDSMPS